MQDFQVEPLTDRIFLVGEGLFPRSKSIIALDEETVLIDTGCGIRNLEEVKRKYGIDYVINSHTHPDHSAGNWVFAGRSIHVPEERFETSGNASALGKRFVGEERVEDFRTFTREAMGFQDCKPTQSFRDGSTFHLGKTTLEAIRTPGHTTDHYCLFEPEAGILFSFDYDLTPFPWYGHVESSLDEFRESIGRLKTLRPKVVVSSHRGVVRDNIDAEFDAYLRRIGRRSEKVLSLLDTGKTIEELVDCAPVYGSFPYAESLLRYWEKQMIEKHLVELQNQGKVVRQDDVYFKK